ncbi:hypothetical protein K501DRAFT_43547 [Backusella circina FSU 941]|nr:hypothetical protein K501DRAFT_43547 [Backusella circina FSU 941]
MTTNIPHIYSQCPKDPSKATAANPKPTDMFFPSIQDQGFFINILFFAQFILLFLRPSVQS